MDESEKAKFPYRKGPSGMGYGYELKKDPGPSQDRKEDFNFAREAMKWMCSEEMLQLFRTPQPFDFIHAADCLVRQLVPVVQFLAFEIEDGFSLPGFADDVMAGIATWSLRALFYPGDRKVGDVMALAHADKDGFTVNLHETTPGLQCMDFGKQWRDVPLPSPASRQTLSGSLVCDNEHDVGFTVIPGMRLQHRSRNRLKGIYHQVVATETSAAQGRFSMVLFVHPANTAAYDKARAGRIQTFSPGFNYDMPFDEFRKLFVEQ
jgi:isopenicillin N synthase-like dioxygenase